VKGRVSVGCSELTSDGLPRTCSRSSTVTSSTSAAPTAIRTRATPSSTTIFGLSTTKANVEIVVYNLAPTLKIEPNLFGGFDLRQTDGKVVRCEKKASGETECRVVQEGRKR